MGRHSEIACETCHVESAEVVKLSMSCNDCHQIVDVHHGLLGSKCEDCHSFGKWESTTFDHKKDTRFELRGAHPKVDCVGCHRTAPRKQDSLETCRSCHAGELTPSHTPRVARGRQCIGFSAVPAMRWGMLVMDAVVDRSSVGCGCVDRVLVQ